MKQIPDYGFVDVEAEPLADISFDNIGNLRELNSEGIGISNADAGNNGIKNIRFYCDDAGDFMNAMKDENMHADVVFMDPPRSGSTGKFISSLLKIAPKKIVYISCNPETLARDLRKITKGNYKVTRITPVDMFPHTNHVETVVLMSKTVTRSKSHVDLGLDVEDYYKIKDAEKEQE